MAWSILVSALSEGSGITQVGWRFSTQVGYTWVPPDFFCVDEDEIPDNVSVDLTLRFESGYTIDAWKIGRDGSYSETKTSVSIQVKSEGATAVQVIVTAKEEPPPPPPADTSCYIGDNGAWTPVTVYIGDNGVWVPSTLRIGNGGTW